MNVQIDPTHPPLMSFSFYKFIICCGSQRHADCITSRGVDALSGDKAANMVCLLDFISHVRDTNVDLNCSITEYCRIMEYYHLSIYY